MHFDSATRLLCSWEVGFKTTRRSSVGAWLEGECEAVRVPSVHAVRGWKHGCLLALRETGTARVGKPIISFKLDVNPRTQMLF
jgi:hypothetical protein